ncbi:MAG: DUF2062 domain-containing protein [Nanoarchaeota archaeon]|nr:DUF2062 domain-containing protein [Nanoarchaeota archaeon]MBU1051350.1 DUF2062 domain-containing protein [Nanoarchaeota archaeon]MBU1988611.1 DUF2062 domain-containing protein [Nanoarchaeota archaeon]
MIQKIKKHLREVIELKTSPREIATGFALGTLLAILPTFGFGILMGLLVILIFKGISKISMIAAFAIWNPLVLIPIAALSYKIGDLILSEAPKYTFRIEIINQVYVYSRRFILGNIIVATIFTIISYFVVYFFVNRYQNKHK